MGWDVVVLSAICIAGLAIGVSFIVRWGQLSTRVAAPGSPIPTRAADVLLSYLRTCAIGVSAGAIAGDPDRWPRRSARDADPRRDLG